MRQRAVIAMAIANDPDLIIADEPTTALDVTVQAQVLEVLETAQQVTGAGIVMITHDLGVVAGHRRPGAGHVRRQGRSRSAPSTTIYADPRMPYTMGLLGSIPRLDAAAEQPLVPIEGQPPSLAALPPGCPFAPRCPIGVAACDEVEPPLRPPGRRPAPAACIRSDEIDARGASTAAESIRAPEVADGARAGAARAARRSCWGSTTWSGTTRS